MASIDVDVKTGYWQVRFCLWGRQHKRSLKTTSDVRAETQRRQIEEMVGLIQSGRLAVPDGVDAADFVMLDGRAVKQTASIGLKAAIDRYNESLPSGAKEASTLLTERIHFNHLVAVLGARTSMRSIGHEKLQKYIHSRSQKAAGQTIKKEIATFRVLWNFCRRARLVESENPTRGLKFPRSPERRPFRTKQEIEASGDDDWEGLFLSVVEVREVLALLKEKDQEIHLAASIAAWTGARLSELLRIDVRDVDLDSGFLTIRERKRAKGKSVSYRLIPIGDELRVVLEPHVRGNVGKVIRLRLDQMKWRLKVILEDSGWHVGWHTFRHSFCSNLARMGASQAMIDEWMGHSTEQQRRRYRHLFPTDQAAVMRRLMEE